jgi:hypothetical protein
MNKEKEWHSKQITDFEGEYEGAMAGIFWLDKDAKEILDGNIIYGETFAYLFRRFGYPRFGWDDYKTLVHYYLSTPMDGVVLIVEPNAFGICPFGYLLRKDLDIKCYEEERKPITEWFDRLYTWVKKEHDKEFYDVLGGDTEGIQKTWINWLSFSYPNITKNGDVTKEIQSEFFNIQWKLREKYMNLYKEIENTPKRNDKITDLPDTSIRKKCYEALCTAIKDLLTPVNIRDVLINIKGHLDDDEWDNCIKYSSMSGYGIGNKMDNIENEK